MHTDTCDTAQGPLEGAPREAWRERPEVGSVWHWLHAGPLHLISCTADWCSMRRIACIWTAESCCNSFHEACTKSYCSQRVWLHRSQVAPSQSLSCTCLKEIADAQGHSKTSERLFQGCKSLQTWRVAVLAWRQARRCRRVVLP